MSSSDPNPRPAQTFNDALARMMQAEVNEGGPPPATPCDTPAEVISHIHMAEPTGSTSSDTGGTFQKTRNAFERALTENLDRLDEEIQAARAKGATLEDAAKARWNTTIADLEAKRKAAREKLDEVGRASEKAWEHLREGARHAWQELEHAVHEARSEF